MTHPDQYSTIIRQSEGDYRERGSKFLSYAFHAENETDVKAFIDGLKKTHPTARHFCWGAVLGSEQTEERSNDWGEPSGTAGLPILNKIISFGLKNTAVVVVRYFGGSKLGKAGLIAAYKIGTQLALEANRPVIRFNTSTIQFTFEYSDMGNVMHTIDQFPHSKIKEQVFLESCVIKVELPKSEVANSLNLFDHTNEVNVEEID